MKGINLGEKNGNWKGDKVKYSGLHGRIRRRKPKPLTCEICHKKSPFEVANISGEYKKELLDWIWLCRSCHMKNDGRLEKLHLHIPKIRICKICGKKFLGDYQKIYCGDQKLKNGCAYKRQLKQSLESYYRRMAIKMNL